MLRQAAGKSRKQKRTTKQLHADLAALGYDGSYNRVAAFARDWKAARQQEQRTCGRGVFVPLAFLPGEAFQFDWSEDWAIIGGERTKLQVAHVKLSRSIHQPSSRLMLLTLTTEPQANVERYDALRKAREARHAS